jgi:hypothetical protein
MIPREGCDRMNAACNAIAAKTKGGTLPDAALRDWSG